MVLRFRRLVTTQRELGSSLPQVLLERYGLFQLHQTASAALLHGRNELVLQSFVPDVALLRTTGSERHDGTYPKFGGLLEQHLKTRPLLNDSHRNGQFIIRFAHLPPALDDMTGRDAPIDVIKLDAIPTSLPIHDDDVVTGDSAKYFRCVARLLLWKPQSIPGDLFRWNIECRRHARCSESE